MHSIKHPGNSGDIVRVAVSEKGETVVWKSAQGSRAVRLEAQAAKQRHMFHVVREVFARDVFVPQILSEAWTSRGEKDEEYKFSMDYVPFDAVPALVKFGDLETLRWFMSQLISLVEQIKTKCCEPTLMKEIFPLFEAKKVAILSAISANKSSPSYSEEAFLIAELALSFALQVAKSHMDVKVPVGFCHGDLTFSNLLVNAKSRRIALFDFLDSFVESPLQDLAKLRQDTAYFWLCESDGKESVGRHEWNRLYTTLNAFDTILLEYIEKHEWSSLYPVFELFSLCRILPYCKTQERTDWCVRSIKKALDSWIKKEKGNEALQKRVSVTSPKHSMAGVSNVKATGTTGDSSTQAGGVNLVLVAAATGTSAAFPGSSVPKWVNRLPNGQLMIAEAFAGLSLVNVDRIIVIVQKKHLHRFFGGMPKMLLNELKAIKQLRSFEKHQITIVALPGPTAGQINSVHLAISDLELRGALFVKDAYCSFKAGPDVIRPYYNGVVYFNVVNDDQNTVFYNIGKKSFVELANDNLIGNIVEKHVISSMFGVGGYMFEDVSEFLIHVSEIQKANHKLGSLPIRCSDVIWSMIIRGCNNSKVIAYESPTFHDFSTIDAWHAHWAHCIQAKESLSRGVGSPLGVSVAFDDRDLPPMTMLPQSLSGSLSQRGSSRIFHVVMPMGGLGSRFTADSFFKGLPKPLIEIDGQPMFLKCLSSLQGINAQIELTVIFRKEHEVQFNLGKKIRAAYPAANIVIIPHLTKGAVETFLACRHRLRNDDAVLICDCDLWFDSPDFLQAIENVVHNRTSNDGLLLSFNSDNPRYSYAKVHDGTSFLSETREKVVISSNAICGAYFFSRAETLLRCCDKLMAMNLEDIGLKEYYCSALYNILLGMSANYRVQVIKLNSYASFGTPQEYYAYKKSGPQIKERETIIH